MRTTLESLRRLKDESFDGSCLMKSSCKEEEEEEKKCIVCLEGFEENTTIKHSVSRLPCSHMFHFRCVSHWFSLDHCCPVCRSPMPWVHAFFPDAPLLVSHYSTATSYLDLDDDDYNDDDESHNFIDDLCYSSDTTEPSGILTKLECFVKKIVQNMLTLDDIFWKDSINSWTSLWI